MLTTYHLHFIVAAHLHFPELATALSLACMLSTRSAAGLVSFLEQARLEDLRGNTSHDSLGTLALLLNHH